MRRRLLQRGVVAALAFGILTGSPRAGHADETPYLVKDLNPTDTGSSYPGAFTALNGELLFLASDGRYPLSLWKSDGSETGTVRLTTYLSLPYGPIRFEPLDDRVLFVASDFSGYELWVSDATADGTRRLADIVPGPDSSTLMFLGRVGNQVLFFANDGDHGFELWASDGTGAGTRMVKDINPGPGNGYVPLYGSLSIAARVDGSLFFAAKDGRSGVELWKSDGTEAGTVRVKDIRPGSGSSEPISLTAAEGRLYFYAIDDDGVFGVWTSDGTDAGTVELQPLGSHDLPFDLAAAAGTAFFGSSLGGTYGFWKTDGTAAGTSRVSDILQPAYGFYGVADPNHPGTLWFTGCDAVNGCELWKSDGTRNGTAPIVDIYAGSGSSNPLPLATIDGALLFAAYDGLHGSELWRTDGTSAGTELVKDLDGLAGGLSSVGSTPDVAVVNGSLFFAGTDASGTELWKSDGTASGTVQVKNINDATAGSNPQQFTNVNGTLGFVAATGNNSWQLWKSDGTGAGTVPIVDMDLQVGQAPMLLSAGGRLLFLKPNADDGALELWSSDGSAAGTARVIGSAELGNNLNLSYPDSISVVGGALYFTTYPTTGGRTPELWRSDGSPAGTMKLLTSKQNFGPSFEALTQVDDTLFFMSWGDSSNDGWQLWKSDGTARGTKQVTIPCRGSGACSDPAFGGSFSLTNLNGRLFFIPMSYAPSSGELWTSDGTAAGTVLVKRVDRTAGIEHISPAYTVGNHVLFIVYYSDNSTAVLWASDGTAAGSAPLIQYPRNSFGSDVIVNARNRLFFIAQDSSGPGLWTSDGTAAGTSAVKAGISQLSNAVVAVGVVYFSDASGILWQSDGTPEGTVQISTLNLSTAACTPQSTSSGTMAIAGQHLYFAATDGQTGCELWAVAGIPICGGDCNGDGEITINELVTMVRVAVAPSDAFGCPPADRDADGVITVDEIVATVNNAVTGCPATL